MVSIRGNIPSSTNYYTHFHGMLCSPKTASQSIKDFDGTILFMPSTYTPENLAFFDSSSGIWNTLSYYLLVVVSLTGLSTLLGMTDFLVASEVPTEDLTKAEGGKDLFFTSEYNSKLQVENYVLDYCKRHTNAKSLYLKRHFEYNFRLLGLEVVMLHFLCDQDKLHLVEVYHFNHWFWQNWLAPFLTSLIPGEHQKSVKDD